MRWSKDIDLDSKRDEILGQLYEAIDQLNPEEKTALSLKRQEFRGTREQAVDVELALEQMEKEEGRAYLMLIAFLIVVAILDLIGLVDSQNTNNTLIALTVFSLIFLSHLQRKRMLESLRHQYRRDWLALGIGLEKLFGFVQCEKDERSDLIAEDVKWKRFETLEAEAGLRIIQVLRPEVAMGTMSIWGSRQI